MAGNYAPNYYGGSGGSSPTADEIATAVIAKYKADPQLGTADGGLVAEVNKIHRAATAVPAGAAMEKELVDAIGNTLQKVHEKLNGEVV